MEWLSDPTIWMGLATLVVLEIILGISSAWKPARAGAIAEADDLYDPETGLPA